MGGFRNALEQQATEEDVVHKGQIQTAFATEIDTCIGKENSCNVRWKCF